MEEVKAPAAGGCELTILMPCLDEGETLATCIGKARAFLERSGVAGEVLVADGGSFAPDLFEHLNRAQIAQLFHDFFSPASMR